MIELIKKYSHKRSCLKVCIETRDLMGALRDWIVRLKKLYSQVQKNKNSNWSLGSSFEQWRCNTQIARNVGNKSPYELLIGQKPKQWIYSLHVSNGMLLFFRVEDELNRMLNIKWGKSVENLLRTTLVSGSLIGGIASSKLMNTPLEEYNNNTQSPSKPMENEDNYSAQSLIESKENDE